MDGGPKESTQHPRDRSSATPLIMLRHRPTPRDLPAIVQCPTCAEVQWLARSEAKSDIEHLGPKPPGKVAERHPLVTARYALTGRRVADRAIIEHRIDH
jgi:hypothetical protein